MSRDRNGFLYRRKRQKYYNVNAREAQDATIYLCVMICGVRHRWCLFTEDLAEARRRAKGLRHSLNAGAYWKFLHRLMLQGRKAEAQLNSLVRAGARHRP